MPTQSAEHWEDVARNRLRAVRDKFATALAGTGPNGNAFSVLSTELHVDQIRRIASSAGGAVYWSERDGLRYIPTTTAVGQLFLGFIVGRKRLMPADGFIELLVDLCLPQPRTFSPEMEVACFVNLAVVEPFHNPACELPIWATIAHRLATEREKENLFAEIPGLVTDHDILYREIPLSAPYADSLIPHADVATAETLPRYQAMLLCAVLPALADQVAGLTSDAERSALFADHEAELRAYVRTHVFMRVAALAEA